MEMIETGLGGGRRLADIVTQFTYDENGNQILITDARNADTHSEFDPLDRLVLTTYADNSFTQLEYDADDHVIASIDNNGLKVLFELDAIGRKKYVHLDKTGLHGYTYPIGAEEFEEYIYDGLGRVLQHKNDFCEINAKFDSFGRSYEEQIHFTTPYGPPVPPAPLAANFLLGRTFDVLSNRIGIIYPSGREIQYHYDVLNRLDKIENISKGIDYPGSATFPAKHEIAMYEYRGRRLGKVMYGNQTEYTLAYDGLGRIISTKNESGGALLLEMQQLYDGVGNRRFQLDNPAVAIRPGGETYAYDSSYRLTKFERKPLVAINPTQYEPPNAPLLLAEMTGQQTIDTTIGSMAQDPLDYTYKYDALGNRKEEKQADQPSVPYVANALNQYETKDAIHFQYDLNGNLLDDGTWKYLYNYRNLLVQVLDKVRNTDVLRLSFDATGRLIAFHEGASAVHLINDGLNVIEEYGGVNVTSQYVYENGIDRRCQMVNGGKEWWNHCDLIRSTRLLSDSSGLVAAGARCEYDPFGSVVSAPLQYNPYLFAGKRLFKPIDLYDSRARQYSPALGRFLQRDPKGLVDGLNLYAYCSNNPATFGDLLGTEKNSIGASSFKEYPVPYFDKELNTIGLDLSGESAVRIDDTVISVHIDSIFPLSMYDTYYDASLDTIGLDLRPYNQKRTYRGFPDQDKAYYDERTREFLSVGKIIKDSWKATSESASLSVGATSPLGNLTTNVNTGDLSYTAKKDEFRFNVSQDQGGIKFGLGVTTPNVIGLSGQLRLEYSTRTDIGKTHIPLDMCYGTVYGKFILSTSAPENVSKVSPLGETTWILAKAPLYYYTPPEVRPDPNDKAPLGLWLHPQFMWR